MLSGEIEGGEKRRGDAQNVLGLEVSVDDVFLVHGGHGQQNFCCVKPSPRLGESVLLLYPEEELASARILEDHVELLRRLECVDEVDEKGTVDSLEHNALRLGVLNLPPLNNFRLAQSLQRIQIIVLVVLLLHQHDLAKRTLAQHF